MAINIEEYNFCKNTKISYDESPYLFFTKSLENPYILVATIERYGATYSQSFKSYPQV